MTAANGDRITVQRVTSTVAGECREWTVTVRQSSPAGIGDPLNAMTPGARQLLPDAVRAALGDWLEGRPLVADGAPLLVGRDFQVGDRVRGEEPAPRREAPVPDSRTVGGSMFPIGRTVPGAPFAGRTAPRRTTPPEAPVRLWNRDYTDKLDVIGRSTGERTPRIEIRAKDVDAARVWIDSQIDDDGHVFVVWLEREWSLAGYASDPDRLTLAVEALPKPPRVEQVLGRVPGGGAGPRIEPPVGIVDGAPYAGPFPDLAKGDRIGVEHPDGTITTHKFSGDHEHPVADEPDRAGRWRAVETMGRQFAERFYREPEPAPEAYTMPDGVGLGTVPEYGQPVGTVTSGLIHTEPERCAVTTPDPVSDNTFTCGLDSWTVRSIDLHSTRDTTVHLGPLPGEPGAPDTKTPAYADLYARLPYLHDAVAEEES